MKLSINKNSIIVILGITLIALILVGYFFGYKKFIKIKRDKVDIEYAYYQAQRKYQKQKTVNGLLITEAKEFRYTIKQLRNAEYTKDSTLIAARKLIDNQKQRIKTLKSILQVELESKGEGIVYVEKDKVEEKEDKIKMDAVINDGYLNQNLTIYCQDSIEYNYVYTENIDVVVNGKRKPRPNGKKAFILIRWLRPIVYNTFVTPEKKDSKINVATHIKFNK